MLLHTFIHLPGIGPKTERNLWDEGILTWDDFLEARLPLTRLHSRHGLFRSELAECEKRLQDADSSYFRRTIPSREGWRMYADFRINAAFLDIETTGLFPYQDKVTLVGILDSKGYHAFIRGRNLRDIRTATDRHGIRVQLLRNVWRAIKKYDLIVTYNGTLFDLPFLESTVRGSKPLIGDIPHIDLRFTLRRIGLTGGLKAIEREIGMVRETPLSSLDGYDAVRLWKMWEAGDEGALHTLIRYNAEDVLSLPRLADMAYNELAQEITAPVPLLKGWEVPRTDLPYDLDVIRRLRSSRPSAWF